MENKYVGLEKILKKESIKYNESMKNHTTMKVGGPCDCLVLPESVEEIKQVVRKTLETLQDNHVREWSTIKATIKDKIRDYLFQKNKRNPMVLPIIIEA